MNSETEWTVYSSSQNLPAVLNDPNRGKQTNFFTKTWGDSFVESSDVGKSPFLPEISTSHFESYLRKYGRKHRRHIRLSQSRIDNNRGRSISEGSKSLTIDHVPEIFLQPTLPLNDPVVFNTLYKNLSNSSSKTGRDLLDQFSYYLDYVEEQIAKQVSQKSGSFFHAMTSHDTIMEQLASACKQVRHLRDKIQGVDKMLAKDSLKLLGLARSKHNHSKLVYTLKLMATVLQTQPTLQLLLSSSDYVAALELISSTQEVLSKELAGVTSLRHLPSQLKEMSRLIDKMLSSEFEKYAAADLHRPLDPSDGVVDQERLTSLVAGLLRQNNLHFLEVYKQEAVTAAQTIVKQTLIEELADVEDDMERCLTGSVDAPPSLDCKQWLKVLSVAGSALGKLIQRVKAVHDVVKRTADVSAGLLNSSELIGDKFLSAEDHKRVESRLRDLLNAICDYFNEKLASVVSTQTDKQNISAVQITELSEIVENFTVICERVCGRQSPALKAAFKIQAGNYVHKFHSQRKNKLTLLLNVENWKSAEVPPEFQIMVNKMSSGKPMTSLPGSPVEENELKSRSGTKPLGYLKIGSQNYITVGTVLILIRLVSEYCVCAYDLPLLAPMIGKNLSELLRTFNSKSYLLVLDGIALKTPELNTIINPNLALISRSFQLVLWLIPHIRAHFATLSSDPLASLDVVERNIGHHIQQLETKILSVMNIILGDLLNDWEAKPPVPSKTFRSISRYITKLYEVINPVLPEEQVTDMYEVVHKNFKARLREELMRRNIQNNGGPQHGVVTSEILFYLETLKNLKVLPEKYYSEKAMDDIWLR